MNRQDAKSARAAKIQRTFIEHTMAVYVALVEVCPFDGCDLDPHEIAGAFVRCYIPASNSDDAITKLKASLDQNRLQLVEVEWCVNDAETEWENPNDEVETDLISQAEAIGDVHYGAFHTWGHDAPDV